MKEQDHIYYIKKNKNKKCALRGPHCHLNDLLRDPNHAGLLYHHVGCSSEVVFILTEILRIVMGRECIPLLGSAHSSSADWSFDSYAFQIQ